MSIQQQIIDDIIVLKPTGRLDSSNSAEFERVLLEALDTGPNKIIFDLSDLDYISSAGLRVILLAGKKMRETKGYIALAGLRANVNDIFAMSGFHNIFKIFPHIQEARTDAQTIASE